MEIKLNLSEHQINQMVLWAFRLGFARASDRTGKKWTAEEINQAVQHVITEVWAKEPIKEVEVNDP